MNTRMYSPEKNSDGRATVYIWHVRIEGEPHEMAVRATHLHIDQDACFFLLDHNFGDAVMFVSPRERMVYIQRYAAVTAPSGK